MKTLYCIDEDGYLELPESLLKEAGILPDDEVELFINELGELVIQKVVDDEVLGLEEPQSWILVSPLPILDSGILEK